MEHGILLTGASGFLGGATLRALTGRGGTGVRALFRTPDGMSSPQGTSIVRGDLTSPDSLAGACAGVDTVVHAASYVGGDAELCDAVNRRGTEALVRAATDAGVRRVLHVSTASVYGNGPHRDAVEGSLGPAPVSPASRSRLAAEDVVRAAGGVVVRPHLVYGAGDRWFVPTLLAVVRRLGGWVDDGGALLSTVSADDLGRALAGLAVADDLVPGSVLHANHPDPAPVRTIVETATRALGAPVPKGGVPRADALRAVGSARHLTMIAEDHWYASRRIWELAGCLPGEPFECGFGRYAHWYREHALAGAGSGG